MKTFRELVMLAFPLVWLGIAIYDGFTGKEFMVTFTASSIAVLGFAKKWNDH